MEIISNIINVFTVTFDWFNASLLKQIKYFILKERNKERTDHKVLNLILLYI